MNSDAKRHEILFHQATQITKKITQKRQDLSSKQLDGCTFTPAINKSQKSEMSEFKKVICPNFEIEFV